MIAQIVPPSTSLQTAFRLAAPVLVYVAVALRRLCAAALSFVVGIIAQIFIAALVVTSAVPALRGLVMRLQKIISETIGDSYALVGQPTAFDSMVRRVNADVDWLLERCERVAVVAHTQGAAIAHQALKERHTADVSLLITFGAGIAKLKVLTGLAFGRAAVSFGLRVLALCALLAAAAVASTSSPIALALGLSAALLLMGAAQIRPEPDARASATALDLPGLGTEGGLRWVDLFASSDPVPEGSLATSARIGLISQEIYNRRSTFSDHTTYWRNAEGFVSRVCAELARVAEWQDYQRLTRNDERVTSAAVFVRSSRTDYLSFGRWAAAGVTVAALCSLSSHGLETITNACGRVLRVVPGTEYVATRASFLSSNAGVSVFFGAIVVAVAVSLAYAGLFLPAWGAWDLRGRENMVRRAPDLNRIPLPPKLALTTLLVGWIPVVFLIGSGNLATPGVVVAAMLTILFVAIIWLPNDDQLTAAPASLYVCRRSNLEPWADFMLGRPRYVHTQYVGLAAASDAAWICCGPVGILAWLALDTGARYDIPVRGSPKAVRASGGRVWIVTDDSLVEVDARAKEISAVYLLEPGLEGLAVDGPSVWVAAASSSTVLRVDSGTGRVAAVIPVAARPVGIAANDGRIWVSSSPSGTLTQVDPHLNEVVAEIDLKAVPFGSPVATFATIFVYDLQGALVSVDVETFGVKRALPSPHSTIGGIASHEGRLWLVDGWGRRAFEVSDGRRSRQLRLPRRGQEIAVTDEWICVATHA